MVELQESRLDNVSASLRIPVRHKKKKKDSENHSRDVNANIDTFGEMVGEKRVIEMSERKTAE